MMARMIVMGLTLSLLAGCAGMYVAGDAGPHHDHENLSAAAIGSSPPSREDPGMID